MKAYKLEFSRHEMMMDSKATGQMKKLLQRKVRLLLKKDMKKDIKENE